MKKLIILICFLAGIRSSFAQDKYIDSLKNVLAQTTKPIDRFSTIVKIAENKLVLQGGAIDTATTMQLLRIAQQLNNDSLLAIAYNWIGAYMGFIKGDNTASLDFYFKALPLAEKAHDKRRISSLYFDIALVYFVLQNNEEAGKNIRKGGENLPDVSSPMYSFMLIQYQRNISQYYLFAHQYDSALHYAQALVETSTKLKSLSFLYGAMYLNGSIYEKMEDKEMAEVYFKKAMAMNSVIGSSSNKLNFYEAYIRFLLNNNKINEAHQQANELMELGRHDNNDNLKLSASRFIQQIFDTLHQTDSAYYFAKMKDELTASIFSQDNINKTQALAFNDQLRTMEDNAKKAEEAQKRKENIQYALIALGIISLLMLYLLLSRSFITNSKLIEFFGVIALLIVFEFLNLLLHPFLERITHHSPVLMLLALVCIAALLVPLHHKVEKWATHKLVEKNKKIRLAAAKRTIEKLEKEKLMAQKRSFPAPLTILMVVIILSAACTWILPAGQYNKLAVSGQSFTMTTDSSEVTLPLTQRTLDSLGIRIALQKFVEGDIRKPVSIPGTFAKLKKNPQGFIKILQAPIKGIYDSIDIILFVLIIGGFMYVFNETGAMTNGIAWLSHTMRGREPLLIAILTFVLSFFAASYGMGEEALVFYPILVPLFLAAGYDLLVPLAIIFGGTMVGGIPAFSNPFSTIIGSNAAGINWLDGLTGRLVLWVIVTGLMVWYILRYAAKVKKDPAASLVLKIDGAVQPHYDVNIGQQATLPKLEGKTKLLLLIYLITFLSMIAGVVFLKWWMLEMSALFLASSFLVALISRINEKVFVKEFIKGAENLLSVAFIIGVARGVTIILTEGHISDAILFYTANIVQGVPPALFILLLLIFYLFFSLFIQSTSGMAVLTMPIIGALAVIVNIPGREIVNSYIYGICIMSFIAPTGLVLPSLAMVNVSLKTWLKFITPFLIIITLVCMAALVIGIYL